MKVCYKYFSEISKGEGRSLMSNKKIIIYSFILAFLIVAALFYIDNTAFALSVRPV